MTIFLFNEHGQSPTSIVVGVEEETDILDYYSFGCPLFVLDEKKQSALGGMPKWDPNARAGLYLGRSPVHSSRVALVLHMLTVHVSPQHRLVFDDEFSTVSYLHKNNTQPHNWINLIKNHGRDNETADTSL